MKRLTALILALIMTSSLCACSGGVGNNSLSVEELKGIIAVKPVLNHLNDTLRDPESASILGVTVVNVPGDPQGYHMVKVEYNAANGMGGKERDTFYIETNRGGLGDNLEYFSDNYAERIVKQGNNFSKYNECIDGGMDEIEVDVDTVMNNLDLTEDELVDLVWEKYDELGIE